MVEMNRRRLFGLGAMAAVAGCSRIDAGNGDAVRAGTGEIAEIIGSVPPISAFPTAEEMNTFVDRLAVDHPGRVLVTEIGRSRSGQTIRNVRIGSGPRPILVLGSPHSNEPIGLATTRHLLSRLAADESLTSSLEATWNFVPLVDPDATRLGEGWFGGPFTRTTVARHFYRPPSDLQAEWTFPMNWRGTAIGRPLPETQALMTLIDATRPALVASLHNADFSGGFAYVSGGDSDYWNSLTRHITGNGLPLYRGEPDAPGAELLAEGIFRMPSFDQMCGAIAAGGEDPLSLSGGSSGHYAGQYGGAYLVSELPLWTDPRLADHTGSEMSVAELNAACAASAQEIADTATDVLARMGGLLSRTSPFHALVEASIPAARATAAAKRAARAPDRKATRSEVATDLYGWSAMLRLRMAGPLARLLREEATRTGSPELHAESVRFDAVFDRWCAEIERDAPGELVPPNRLVAIQASSVITAVTRLRDQRPV
ncbi:M14 family zinc carboxypeptidase [Nocardia lijiangensis]|uniref:M14 family zinc carboxypeptidase n=1 Tax=Nocardia lijiangensis TaxID=299618 RepID=UPI00082BDE80|nr:M14 family zinc carboxypeptidase [Nocardia lijiangensis]